MYGYNRLKLLLTFSLFFIESRLPAILLLSVRKIQTPEDNLNDLDTKTTDEPIVYFEV